MLVMKIAVCDDVSRELEQCLYALKAYEQIHPEFSFETDAYETAEALLSAVEKGKTYDLLLLDICNPDTGIIFLTASSEYAVEAFALNAVHYLLKPFTQEQFCDAMDRGIQRKGKAESISLACVDGMYRVCIGEIAFIESQKHYLQMNLSDGRELKLRRTISSLWEEIREYPEFTKIGASYIVNLSFAKKMSASCMEMEDGIKIPIPRRCEEAVRKNYMDFCRREVLK